MSAPRTPRSIGAGTEPAATISWRGLTLELDTDADTPHWTYEDAELYVGVCDETLKEPCSANIQVLGLTGEGIAGTVVEALEKAFLDAKRNVHDAGASLLVLDEMPR